VDERAAVVPEDVGLHEAVEGGLGLLRGHPRQIGEVVDERPVAEDPRPPA
jgi:hypothetical protein